MRFFILIAFVIGAVSARSVVLSTGDTKSSASASASASVEHSLPTVLASSVPEIATHTSASSSASASVKSSSSSSVEFSTPCEPEPCVVTEPCAVPEPCAPEPQPCLQYQRMTPEYVAHLRSLGYQVVTRACAPAPCVTINQPCAQLITRLTPCAPPPCIYRPRTCIRIPTCTKKLKASSSASSSVSSNVAPTIIKKITPAAPSAPPSQFIFKGPNLRAHASAAASAKIAA